jgi:hypothetical protein
VSGTGSTQPREELLGRKNSGSDLESRKYDRRDPLRWLRDTYPQKLALTSPTGGSVGIVLSLTQATEFFLCFIGTHTLLWIPVPFRVRVEL